MSASSQLGGKARPADFHRQVLKSLSVFGSYSGSPNAFHAEAAQPSPRE